MKKPVWQAPTRRAFVTMLGLGAAALAVVKVQTNHPKVPASSPIASIGPTLWIGHC